MGLILVHLVSGQKPSSLAYRNTCWRLLLMLMGVEDIVTFPVQTPDDELEAHLWLVRSLSSHGQKVTHLKFGPKSFKSKTNSPFVHLYLEDSAERHNIDANIVAILL